MWDTMSKSNQNNSHHSCVTVVSISYIQICTIKLYKRQSLQQTGIKRQLSTSLLLQIKIGYKQQNYIFSSPPTVHDYNYINYITVCNENPLKNLNTVLNNSSIYFQYFSIPEQI